MTARNAATMMGVLAVAIHATVAPAPAATLAVPEDFASIGAALAAADPGDIVLVGCGTYREHGLRVPDGVNLWSATLQPDCAVIDAAGQGRVLEFEGCGPSTSVVGLTLRGGAVAGSGGLVRCVDAAPSLRRCRLIGGRAGRGGGLACAGTDGPTLEACEVIGNEADRAGGGVFWQANDGRLVDCTVVENVAGGAGGGIGVAGGRVEIRGCVVARNDGGLAGAALSCAGGDAIVTGCTVVDNRSDAGGAALLLQGGGLDATRTLLAFNRPAAAAGTPGIDPSVTLCNVVGHPSGDWSGPLAPLANHAGNFSADPLFCDRAGGVYALRPASPCLPGAAEAGPDVLIGALGQGCD